MSARVIRLRYAGTCIECGLALSVRTRAWWDAEARSTTCLVCRPPASEGPDQVGRKVPRTRGNIDHIVVAASGIWVIDAKRYTGRVERRDVGGWFKTDLRLYVGGRDQAKFADGLAC